MLFVLVLLGLAPVHACRVGPERNRCAQRRMPKTTSKDVALSFIGDAAGSVNSVYYSVNGGSSWNLLSGAGAGPYDFAVPDYTSVMISATANADPWGLATQTVTGSFYIGYSTSPVPESISVSYTDQVEIIQEEQGSWL